MNFNIGVIIIVGLGLATIVSSLNAGLLFSISTLASIPSTNVNDFLRNTTLAFWNSATTGDLQKLSKDTLQQLSYNPQGNIPDKILREINRLLLTGLSNSAIKSKLDNSRISLGDLHQLRRLLSPPESITSDNVTFFGSSILKLGNGFLLRIQNNSALIALNQITLRALATTSDPLLNTNYRLLATHLTQKLNGSPEVWTNDTLRRMDLTTITTDIAMRISPMVVVANEEAVIQSVAGSSNFQLKRIWLTKILLGYNFNSQTDATTALAVINDLVNLRNVLLPEDIKNPSLLSNPDIKAILDENVKNVATTGKLTPKSAYILQKGFANKGNISSDALNQIGKQLIGYSSPRIFKMAALNGAFSANDVSKIASGLLNGTGKDSKLNTLANVVKSSLDPNNPTVQQYPNQVIALLPPSILKKLSQTDAFAVLSRNENDSIMDTAPFLLNKIPSGFSALNVKSRARLSNAKVKLMNQNEAAQVANGLPPSSSVAMVAAETAFSGRTKIDGNVIAQYLSSAPFMGADEAMMVNVSDIIGVLQQMKDINPSIQACCVLKNLYYNYTRDAMESKTEEDTMKKLTVGDIENMPLCVLACFGARAIDIVGDDLKVTILERLGLMVNPGWSIPRIFSMQAIKQGLVAMRNGTGLIAGDVEVIGNALIDTPGEMLASASTGVVPDIINKLQKIIVQMQLKPCFDSKQRDAIGTLVKKFKGADASQWTMVDDVGCLLGYLPPSDLALIPPEVITTASCKLTEIISVVNETMMAMCRSSIGAADFANMLIADMQLKDAQMKAAVTIAANAQTSSRKKRQTTSDSTTICERVGYTGANGFSDSELGNISYTTIMSCLQDFGSQDMILSKAQILASTVRNGVYGSFSNWNASFILNMGFILKGFSSSDFQNFPVFSYGTSFDDVVAYLGSKNMFSTDQVTSLASKVKSQWRYPSSMTADDLETINHLLCGFYSSDISSITNDAFKGAIGTISKLVECPLNPVLTSFATTAKAIYGDPSTWNKSDLAELGVIVSALAPENLNKLDPTSMEGLTPSAMTIMPLDSIKAIDAEQFLYLNPATAQSVSDQQKAVLTPAILRALEVSVAGFFYVDKSGGTIINPFEINLVFHLLIVLCNVIFTGNSLLR